MFLLNVRCYFSATFAASGKGSAKVSGIGKTSDMNTDTLALPFPLLPLFKFYKVAKVAKVALKYK